MCSDLYGMSRDRLKVDYLLDLNIFCNLCNENISVQNFLNSDKKATSF